MKTFYQFLQSWTMLYMFWIPTIKVEILQRVKALPTQSQHCHMFSYIHKTNDSRMPQSRVYKDMQTSVITKYTETKHESAQGFLWDIESKNVESSFRVWAKPSLWQLVITIAITYLGYRKYWSKCRCVPK